MRCKNDPFSVLSRYNFFAAKIVAFLHNVYADKGSKHSIWLIYFITSTQEVVVRAMNPFVTSSFQRHSLTAAVGIMSSLFGGLSKLPLAKILDTWGRPQGLILTVSLWVVGFIMMAACKNVETYAAAQVFSSIG